MPLLVCYRVNDSTRHMVVIYDIAKNRVKIVMAEGYMDDGGKFIASKVCRLYKEGEDHA